MSKWHVSNKILMNFSMLKMHSTLEIINRQSTRLKTCMWVVFTNILLLPQAGKYSSIQMFCKADVSHSCYPDIYYLFLKDDGIIYNISDCILITMFHSLTALKPNRSLESGCISLPVVHSSGKLQNCASRAQDPWSYVAAFKDFGGLSITGC